MSERPDIQRLVGDVARLGKVASVDPGRARITVEVGDLATGPIPWLALRAGSTSCWSPPSVGEQVLLICPEGDAAAAIALPGIFSDAHPAPADTAGIELVRFADGSTASYDAEAKRLAIVLVDGASASIVAPGGLAITGPVSIDGALSVTQGVTAQGDVVGEGVSLHDHVHGQVKAGSDVSGKPA